MRGFGGGHWARCGGGGGTSSQVSGSTSSGTPFLVVCLCAAATWVPMDMKICQYLRWGPLEGSQGSIYGWEGAEGGSILGSVFGWYICLAVPVRVVSVADAFNPVLVVSFELRMRGISCICRQKFTSLSKVIDPDATTAVRC